MDGIKTPLYDCHLALGGKMAFFANHLLPIQYPAGIIAEHMAVRTKCGLFDVSHMGELVFDGADALANINRLFTNDYTNLAIGRVRYGLMCDESGGVLDDLLVYRTGETEYLAVVNAANRISDVAWIKDHLSGRVEFHDISAEVSLISIQGPLSHQVLSKLTASLPEKYYSFINDVDIAGMRTMISQTGYTGEKGYEICLDNENAPRLWQLLLDMGEEYGILPCGLGARDTLRLEASMPLYGHEMDQSVTPLEVGLSFGVKLEKDFIGRDALLALGEPRRQRIGLKVVGRGIIREYQDVFYDDLLIGQSTSGTHCPYLGAAYAMALVKADSVSLGDIVEADVRGRRIKAEVVALPFYQRSK